ncbi:MAG TPA: superinfection immunity protein [Stellaceae bacterium]|nr:superinfection immunity protein [Stellaceae bacterium]
MLGNTVSIILLLLIIALYMLPTVVAAARDHPRRRAIGLLNILLGWTLIGWIALFLWAALAAPQVVEA